VPSALAYATVTGTVVACESVTANVAGLLPLSPSGLTVAFPTLTTGTTGGTPRLSSLTIVPVATASPSVAFTGADSVAVKVSSGSTAVSPTTPTENVFDVSPAAKLSGPLAAP
jgi:hypothetical protein